MYETTVRFNLNLKSSLQSGRYTHSRPAGSIDPQVEKATFDAFNYAISDIAFKAARRQQQTIRNQIEARLGGIAMSELSKMGRQIVRSGIGIGARSQWASGDKRELTIDGPVSRTLREIAPDRVKPMNIFTVSGPWRARTQEYLRRKAKRFGHRKWWYNTGELRQQLINPHMWIGAYGPIRVAWIPQRIETGYAKGGAVRFSTLARGKGRSYTISTGEIKMRILGRITNEMLNGPGMRAYDSRYNGLLESLPESVERKLAGRGDPYRSLIEPFLTFWINRQIPNRIYNALTNSMKPLGVTKG